jgi:hypothetical protein
LENTERGVDGMFLKFRQLAPRIVKVEQIGQAFIGMSTSHIKALRLFLKKFRN